MLCLPDPPPRQMAVTYRRRRPRLAIVSAGSADTSPTGEGVPPGVAVGGSSEVAAPCSTAGPPHPVCSWARALHAHVPTYPLTMPSAGAGSVEASMCSPAQPCSPPEPACGQSWARRRRCQRAQLSGGRWWWGMETRRQRPQPQGPAAPRQRGPGLRGWPRGATQQKRAGSPVGWGGAGRGGA